MNKRDIESGIVHAGYILAAPPPFAIILLPVVILLIIALWT